MTYNFIAVYIPFYTQVWECEAAEIKAFSPGSRWNWNLWTDAKVKHLLKQVNSGTKNGSFSGFEDFWNG